MAQIDQGTSILTEPPASTGDGLVRSNSQLSGSVSDLISLFYPSNIFAFFYANWLVLTCIGGAVLFVALCVLLYILLKCNKKGRGNEIPVEPHYADHYDSDSDGSSVDEEEEGEYSDD